MAFADPNTTVLKSAATPSAASMATTRDPRLDFFRGIAMFIILIAHTPGNWMTLWIPARFGFSDATEIFVFCSGMASAIAFGRAFESRGFALGTARVGFRVWQVYWAHIGLFFAVAATVVALNAMFPDGDRNYVGQLNLWPFFNDTEANLVGLLTLTYVPNYFDILPMYMVVLAMMPLVVLLKWVDLRLAIGFVFVVWFMAQGRVLEVFGLEYLAINLPAEPWSEREWFFNPFGWQLIFFTGFAFMAKWIPAPPVRLSLFGLAVLIVLANVPLSNIGVREFGFDWARDWRIDNRIWITKSDFGILRYIHFLALAYVAYVLVGPKGSRIMPSTATNVLANTWRVVLAVIMKVGQQSLAVFIGSMYLARLLGATFDQIGRNYSTMLLVNISGFAILVAIAYGAGWFKSQPWKKKA